MQLRAWRGVPAEYPGLIDYINYLVCFTFGMMAGGTVVIAMVLVLLKEKDRRHGP